MTRKFFALLLVLSLTLSLLPTFAGAAGYDKIVYAYATFNNIPTAENLAPVEEAINVITREKIGVEVKLMPISIADYSSKVSLGLQGGEKIDIFESLGNYGTCVAGDMAYDITELVEQYAAGTKEILGDEIMGAARVNGKLYGIPTYKPFALTPMLIYRQDIANLDAALRGTYQESVYNKYQQDTLRVLSYNVQHCAKGLQRVADSIKARHADVVALQELDSAWARSNYKYQVKELAEATGMYGIFCSALEGYGIGILSNQIPLSIKVVALTPDFEPRRMLVAEFDNYVFASLHVGLSANARRGTGPIIKAEAENWVELGKPLIIAGDFNDDGTDDEMEGARGVLTKYLQENGFTYHSDLTTPTWSDGIYVIDNIISYDPIGGVETISYEVFDDKATSDHMPIIGELLVGFEDPDGVKPESAVVSDPGSSRVYNLNGTQVAESADGIASLPGGIYIFDGKKMKK